MPAATLATGQTSVVISNLAYLVGAVVLAVVIISVVAIRHRRPRTTEQDMDEFHRGLAALNPDRVDHRHRRRRATRFDAPPARRRAGLAGAPPPRRPSTRSKAG